MVSIKSRPQYRVLAALGWTILAVGCQASSSSSTFSAQAQQPATAAVYSAVSLALQSPSFADAYTKIKMSSFGDVVGGYQTQLSNDQVIFNGHSYTDLAADFNADQIGQALVKSFAGDYATVGDFLSRNGAPSGQPTCDDVDDYVKVASAGLDMESSHSAADTPSFDNTTLVHAVYVASLIATQGASSSALALVTTPASPATPSAVADATAFKESASVETSIGYITASTWTDSFSKSTFSVCSAKALGSSNGRKAWGYEGGKPCHEVDPVATAATPATPSSTRKAAK